MKTLSFLVMATGLLVAPAALAQSPSPTEARMDSMDRFFPLSESASAPPTVFRAQTTGQATSSDSEQGYGVAQQVEVVLVPGLSLRAGGELRNTTHGFTPIAQGKYQFLRQADHGLNASAGLRYKQVGFQPDGGEVEVFVAAGKRFGRLLATGNVVAGRGVSSDEMDIEGHAGLGYLLGENWLVGLNTRLQQEVEDEGEAEVGHVGREFELLGGAMAGYTWGPVDLSLLGGWYLPRASNSSGPLAMLQLGLNF